MQAMNRKYIAQIFYLWERLVMLEEKKRTPRQIKAELTGLIRGEMESEAFYKHLLEELTVFKDRQHTDRNFYISD